MTHTTTKPEEKREIKFRFWDTEEKVMIDWFTASQTAFNRDGFSLLYRLFFNVRYKKLQYTGLKDKNGKEIYEGDVVNCFTFRPLIVGFNTETAAFGACNDNSMSLDKWYSFVNDIVIEGDAWEIIGNIYENHELLTIK